MSRISAGEQQWLHNFVNGPVKALIKCWKNAFTVSSASHKDGVRTSGRLSVSLLVEQKDVTEKGSFLNKRYVTKFKVRDELKTSYA